jgi:hypothetical protein
MNAGGPALAARRTGAALPDELVVLTGCQDPAVPLWVAGWCQRSGRLARVCHVPGTTSGDPLAANSLAHAVVGLAGSMILVSRAMPTAVDSPRVVAASLRELPGDDGVLDAAAHAAADLGAVLVLMHAVPISFGERSVGLDVAVECGRQLLNMAAQRITAELPGLPIAVRLVRLHAHELVGARLDVDLVVIGGPRIGLPPQLGLVALSAVDLAPCPVLLVPRSG